ncbi:MAG: hypothetical protein V1827_02345 [Candidatus Micrarchaeota archaeon]
MDRSDVFRVGLLVSFFFLIALFMTGYTILKEELKMRAIGAILPDMSGAIPFAVLFASSFIIGASCFSLISRRVDMKTPEILSSFLLGIMVCGALTYLSVSFSSFGYLPYIGIALCAISLPAFLKIRFIWDLKKRFLPFLALLLLPILLLPIFSMDSMYYHAEITRLIAAEGAYPVNFGSGIGLGISSNYPPLFSLFNAFALSGGAFNIYILGISNAVISFAALASIKLFKEIQTRSLIILLACCIIAFTAVDSSYPLQFLFFAVAFHFISAYRESKDTRQLAMSAVFLGGLSLTSYLGLLLSAILAAFLLISDKSAFKHILLFGAICFVVSAPWLLRNLVLSGNPVYPVFNQVFKSPLLLDDAFSFTSMHLMRHTMGDNAILRLAVYIVFMPFLPISLLSIFIAGAKHPPLIHIFLLSAGLILLLAMPVFFLRYFVFFLPSAIVLYACARDAACRDDDDAKKGAARDTKVVASILEWSISFALCFYALSTILHAPCLLCGEEALRYFTNYGLGTIPDYLIHHPEIDRLVAFDLPTLYIPLGTKIIPIDEGSIFNDVRAIEGSDGRICYLNAYADHILLLNNQSARNSPLLDQIIIDTRSQHLELVHSFGTASSDSAIYRITGCG